MYTIHTQTITHTHLFANTQVMISNRISSQQTTELSSVKYV